MLAVYHHKRAKEIIARRFSFYNVVHRARLVHTLDAFFGTIPNHRLPALMPCLFNVVYMMMEAGVGRIGVIVEVPYKRIILPAIGTGWYHFIETVFGAHPQVTGGRKKYIRNERLAEGGCIVHIQHKRAERA